MAQATASVRSLAEAIDGPPRVNELARSAIMAADVVVIPVQPSPYDVWAAEEILGLLQTLNREHDKTIVMVTHDPKAAEYASHTLHLDKGTLVEQVQHAA